MKKHRSESGSYTLEACVSLFFFLVAIYFIFLQVNTLIVESVMQKAVNNMAKEISGFSYILDRAGLVINHDPKELEDAQAILDSSRSLKKNSEVLADSISDLYNGDLYGGKAKEVASEVKSVGDSLKIFMNAIKSANYSDLIENTVRSAGENFIKEGIDQVVDIYCSSKINSFLPTEKEEFCKRYGIDGFDFSGSMFMPTMKNNTVYVEVTCEMRSPFNLPLDLFSSRKIVKTAYAPLWVSSNTNK